MGRSMVLFDELEAGKVMGSHAYTIDEAAFSRWLALYPDDADCRPAVPAGLVTAAIMRAFLRLVDSPPGGIHAGQQLAVQSLPRIGATVTTEITCTGKELRKARRWVNFGLRARDDHGALVATGETMAIWAK